MQKNFAKPLVALLAVVVALILFFNRSKQSLKIASLPEQNISAATIAVVPSWSPESASPSSTSLAATGSADTAQKILTLKQIFGSKNDNDARLDTDFRNLSIETKEALKSLYSETKKENRNERGTIVFLLGREVSSIEELKFFKKVLEEPPCLSLQDCGKLAPHLKDEHLHLESATQVTLLYPQIMALRMQERIYNTTTDSSLKESVVAIIEDTTHSPIPQLSEEARSILIRVTSR